VNLRDEARLLTQLVTHPALADHGPDGRIHLGHNITRHFLQGEWDRIYERLSEQERALFVVAAKMDDLGRSIDHLNLSELHRQRIGWALTEAGQTITVGDSVEVDDGPF
jgi:hypothetical protein